MLGISVRIDVTKIDKTRLFKGDKGTYLDLTTFVNTDEKDKYDNNGFISQSTSKEERDGGIQTPILGNVKVFFSSTTAKDYSTETQSPTESLKDLPDEIPF
jgi:hypothetical protein